MAYFEKENYIHGNLRATSVLQGENNIVKLTDFGMARFSVDGAVMLKGDSL